MKQKLPIIAKKSGFVCPMIHPKEYAWYNKSNEPLRWFLWLTSLEKWFRKTHNVGVFVNWASYNNAWTILIIYLDARSEEERFNKLSGHDFQPANYETKEAALAQGLLEAFNFIKK